jgi:hypothetical protein
MNDPNLPEEERQFWKEYKQADIDSMKRLIGQESVTSPSGRQVDGDRVQKWVNDQLRMLEHDMAPLSSQAKALKLKEVYYNKIKDVLNGGDLDFQHQYTQINPDIVSHIWNPNQDLMSSYVRRPLDQKGVGLDYVIRDLRPRAIRMQDTPTVSGLKAFFEKERELLRLLGKRAFRRHQHHFEKYANMHHDFSALLNVWKLIQ